MAERLRVGLIGLDTSHAVAFTKLLNDPSNEHHVPGAKVTAGFPGGSGDFHLSASRVEGFTRQLKDAFGVEILQTPEAVAERVDLVFISAVDGRAHRDLFERGAGCRQVRATANKDFDLIAAEWGDGRMACIRGMRRGHTQFGAVLHREKGLRFVDIAANKRPYYAGMLEAILGSLSRGRSAVPAEEMLQAVALMEAANQSRQSGQPVSLAD